MAMTMIMAMNVASAQALSAVSSHRNVAALRHCAVALPPLRSAAALPRRLVVVRATSQVDTGSTASSKATVPDTEVSITKVMFLENLNDSLGLRNSAVGVMLRKCV